MGKAHLRAGQTLQLKVEKAGGLLQGGDTEWNHFPAAKTALRGSQGGIGVHGIGGKRRQLPAPQERQLMLLGQAGKARPGFLDHLCGGE